MSSIGVKPESSGEVAYNNDTAKGTAWQCQTVTNKIIYTGMQENWRQYYYPDSWG